MNIKKLNLLLFACVISVVVSCYEDNGNYTYGEINNIEISGLKDAYREYLDTEFNIPITVTSKDKTAEFDYHWIIYPRGTGKLDTIATTKDLKYFVKKPQAIYTLTLSVTEKKTNVKYFFHSEVTIITKYSEGWYVLKDDGTTTDLDLFKLDDDKIDKLENILPVKLQGKANTLTANKEYNYVNSEGVLMSRKKTFFIQAEQDLKVYLIEDMSFARSYKDLFPLEPTSATPKQFTFSSNLSAYAFVDENGVYKGQPNNKLGYFSFPMTIDKGYKMSKHVMRNMQIMVFYDELNCRFLSCPYNGDVLKAFEDKTTTGIPETTNNMNSTCLNMTTMMGIIVDKGMAVMENRDTKKRTVYEFNGNNYGNYKNPIIKVTPIPSNLKMNSLSLFCLNRNSKFIYYAEGNRLGRYNIDGQVEENDILVLDATEEINFLKHTFCNNTKVDKLAIGTVKNGSYKVYLYDLFIGNPTGNPTVLEGTGRVADVLWVSPKSDFLSPSNR